MGCVKPKHKVAPLFFVARILSEASFIRILPTKNPDGIGALCFGLQRRRDSNPRNLSVQRFSRPPRSTALPLLWIPRNSLLSGQPGCKINPNCNSHNSRFAKVTKSGTADSTEIELFVRRKELDCFAVTQPPRDQPVRIFRYSPQFVRASNSTGIDR
jgi:hypothetical protein